MPARKTSRKPVKKAVAKPDKKAARRKGKAEESKTSVMVVDDEEMILLLVKEILEGDGYRVFTASSGMECLDKLENVKPDLLILDVMMSKITGLDVAEAVRLDPKLKDTKIMFLTVVKSTEIKPALMKRLAVSDYVTKPFDNVDLLRRVKWALVK